jgi:uncharacterized protein YhaN
MTIDWIEISGLRGFGGPQRLRLATPTHQPGSGITILVGPNNAGKSTIVEAFRVMAMGNPPSFSEAVRNPAAGSRVSIRLSKPGEGVMESRTGEAGGSESMWEPNHRGSLGLFVLPSRHI